MEIIKKTTDAAHTWADLKAAVSNGTIRELVNSGDVIPATLKNGEAVDLVVTYDKTGRPYFVFNNCINEPLPMNKRNTNKGAWAASLMRHTLNSDILALLPDEIQAVIAPTRIVQIQDGEEIVTEDKLFLLSRTQVCGIGAWSSSEPEDSPLDIFTGERSRVKERADYGTEWWWLRSPSSGSSSLFVGVSNGGGYVGSSGAGSSYGVAPGFCI